MIWVDRLKWLTLVVLGLALVTIAAYGVLTVRLHAVYLLMAICGAYTAYSAGLNLLWTRQSEKEPQELPQLH